MGVIRVVGLAHGGVVVCEGVVDGHIFEEPAHVAIEEALDFCKVELGVDKDGANVGLDDVR